MLRQTYSYCGLKQASRTVRKKKKKPVAHGERQLAGEAAPSGNEHVNPKRHKREETGHKGWNQMPGDGRWQPIR